MELRRSLVTRGSRVAHHHLPEGSAGVMEKKTQQQHEVRPLATTCRDEAQDPSPTLGPVPLLGGRREAVDIDRSHPPQDCASNFSSQWFRSVLDSYPSHLKSAPSRSGNPKEALKTWLRGVQNAAGEGDGGWEFGSPRRKILEKRLSRISENDVFRRTSGSAVCRFLQYL